MTWVKIKIINNGVELSELNKLLQLNNVPAANVSIIGDGTLPTPRIATIAQITASFESYESTLVTINNAAISGAANKQQSAYQYELHMSS